MVLVWSGQSSVESSMGVTFWGVWFVWARHTGVYGFAEVAGDVRHRSFTDSG
jgi:hypothetical protein